MSLLLINFVATSVAEFLDEPDKVNLCLSDTNIHKILVKSKVCPLYFRLNSNLILSWGMDFMTVRPYSKDIDVFVDKRFFSLFERRIENCLRSSCLCIIHTPDKCICKISTCIYCSVMDYHKERYWHVELDDENKRNLNYFCYGSNKNKNPWYMHAAAFGVAKLVVPFLVKLIHMF